MTAHVVRFGGRLFQTCGPAASKVLSPKLLHVRLTTSVQVSYMGVADELTVVDQVTQGVARQGPVDESMINVVFFVKAYYSMHLCKGYCIVPVH